ncbi:MAG: lysophospholipid acyltransferase family protein [bacterium]|nr:lysophospholipid acyltransferase family protein [bacterium]
MENREDFMIKRWIEYFLFLIVANTIKMLPLSISFFLGSILGKIAYIVLPKYRRKAFRNLRLIFPDSSKAKIKFITHKIFQNFGKSFIEFLHFSKANKENIKKYVTVEGINYLKEALEEGKGIIIFSGHLGNWEVIPLTFALMGYPMSVLVKGQSNKYIDNMINRIREKEGTEVIDLGRAPKKIINLLQNGKIVGMVGDQSKDSGIKVNFFNKPILVPQGAASFALRYNAAILPTFDIREENNKHRIIIEPPLTFSESEKEKITLEDIMNKLMKKVEKYVDRYPEQWIWWYHQWKEDNR